ncbi:MAG TPA: phosphoribosylanthranilate isomerase [Polyangia bacterium]
MSASFLIKICGITTPEDARLASAAGATAIGVNFWAGSKRFVGDDAAAADVLAAIAPGVLKVGVFVNAAPAEVLATIERLGLDRAQLHGDEQAGAFAHVPPERLIRAVRVGAGDDAGFSTAAGWGADMFLYDALVDGYGGGGVVAPWSLVDARARRPFLLAGGLTPDNVAAAIQATRPAGVDVASGVEHAPGRKDPARVVAFIRAATEAAAALRAANEAASTLSR